MATSVLHLQVHRHCCVLSRRHIIAIIIIYALIIREEHSRTSTPTCVLHVCLCLSSQTMQHKSFVYASITHRLIPIAQLAPLSLPSTVIRAVRRPVHLVLRPLPPIIIGRLLCELYLVSCAPHDLRQKSSGAHIVDRLRFGSEPQARRHRNTYKSVPIVSQTFQQKPFSPTFHQHAPLPSRLSVCSCAFDLITYAKLMNKMGIRRKRSRILMTHTRTQIPQGIFCVAPST